jgi:integrase
MTVCCPAATAALSAAAVASRSSFSCCVTANVVRASNRFAVSAARSYWVCVAGIGLRREDYGTHSLRRTKASIIYRRTGNLRAVQIPLGHTKIESTVRYLGVDIEDALAISEGTKV